MKRLRKRNNPAEETLLELEDFVRIFTHGSIVYTWPYRAFLDWLIEKHKLSNHKKYYAKKILDRMIAQKLMVLSKEGNLRLLDRGKKKLADIKFRNFSLIKPKVWDGKWRIIVFDIPVIKNGIRMAIKRQIENWGFVWLQNSVWVYPYDCRQVIGLLKEHFEVKTNLIYITAESVEGEEKLKNRFGLI
jgi:DNA-binding transcriptional regulator PaaX